VSYQKVATATETSTTLVFWFNIYVQQSTSAGSHTHADLAVHQRADHIIYRFADCGYPVGFSVHGYIEPIVVKIECAQHAVQDGLFLQRYERRADPRCSKRI
jgi:hypothetical protein